MKKEPIPRGNRPKAALQQLRDPQADPTLATQRVHGSIGVSPGLVRLPLHADRRPQAHSLRGSASEGAVAKAPMQRYATDVVQFAGHAGVMIFGNGNRLLKRIEENEYSEFARIKKVQEDVNDDGQPSDRAQLALAAFPRIHRLIDGSLLHKRVGLGFVASGYGYGVAEKKFRDAHRREHYYVEMENLGGSGTDILDFKIGFATAHAGDLVANHGFTPKEAEDKVGKMGKVDRRTESVEYGMRDSDDLKDNKARGLRRWMGNFQATLVAVDARLEKDGKYSEDSAAVQDLNGIRDFIGSAETVYVASSLVMSWHTDRSTKNETDRIKLVDLAHPVRETMPGFAETKDGMLLGIENLRLMLLGRPRQTRVPG